MTDIIEDVVAGPTAFINKTLFGGGSDSSASSDALSAAKIEANAATNAANIQAQYQQQALDYLKQTGAVPQAVSSAALQKLAGLYGLTLPGTTEQIQNAATVNTSGGGNFDFSGPATQQQKDFFSLITSLSPEQFSTLENQVKDAEAINSGTYGLTGLSGTGETTPLFDQQAMIESAITSPLYQSIMGGQSAGEEAILRNAAATGGLRSGNVQENLYDYNTQLQNQALLQAYNDQMAQKQYELAGLQSLAGLPTNTNQIASTLSNIGSTYGTGTAAAGTATAQGILSAAQIEQAQQQQNIGNLMGLGQLGLLAYAVSDRRLKDNIRKIGKMGPYNFYKFTWNKIAQKMGLKGESAGCMADEVYYMNPEFVTILPNGFLAIYYGKLFDYVKGA